MNNNNNTITMEPTTEIVLCFSFRTHPRVISAIRNVWDSTIVEDDTLEEYYTEENRLYIRKIPQKLKEYVKLGEYDGKEWVVYGWEKWLLDNLHLFRPEHQHRVQRLVQCALDEDKNPMVKFRQKEDLSDNEDEAQKPIEPGKDKDQTEKEPTIEIAVNGDYGGFHLSRAMKHRIPPDMRRSVDDISLRTNPAVIQAIRDTWRLGDKDEDGNCLPLEEANYFHLDDDLGWDIRIRKIPECLEYYVVIGDGREWIEYEWDRWMRHNLDLFKEEEKENMIRLLECVGQEENPARWERPQRYQGIEVQVFKKHHGFGSCV